MMAGCAVVFERCRRVVSGCRGEVLGAVPEPRGPSRNRVLDESQSGLDYAAPPGQQRAHHVEEVLPREEIGGARGVARVVVAPVARASAAASAVWSSPIAAVTAVSGGVGVGNAGFRMGCRAFRFEESGSRFDDSGTDR
jgi:hypothetical protein